jgi:hypothetical protein
MGKASRRLEVLWPPSAPSRVQKSPHAPPDPFSLRPQHCSDRLHQHFTQQLIQGLDRSCANSSGSFSFPRSLQYADMKSAATGSASFESATTTASDLGVATCPTDSLEDPPCCSSSPPPPSASNDTVQSLITEALRSSFLSTDEEVAGTEAGEFVGATAVVAIIGSTHIWVAHCGDSRAVMQRSGDAIALTSDHKPDREDEAVSHPSTQEGWRR